MSFLYRLFIVYRTCCTFIFDTFTLDDKVAIKETKTSSAEIQGYNEDTCIHVGIGLYSWCRTKMQSVYIVGMRDCSSRHQGRVWQEYREEEIKNAHWANWIKRKKNWWLDIDEDLSSLMSMALLDTNKAKNRVVDIWGNIRWPELTDWSGTVEWRMGSWANALFSAISRRPSSDREAGEAIAFLCCPWLRCTY